MRERDGGEGVHARVRVRPGKVLAPLVKRIADGLSGLALADRASMESAVQLSRRA